MHDVLVALSLLLVGLINTLPVQALWAPAKLPKLYGIAPLDDDPNLRLLMRHRALLFGLLGGFMLASLWIETWRLPAMILTLLSMVGFILLAQPRAGFNAAIGRIAKVDIVACVILIPALVLEVW